MLPASEEAPEFRRGHRLDLAPQPIERLAVDAGEEAPVAPRLAPFQAAAEHTPLHLQREEVRHRGLGQHRHRGGAPHDHGPQRFEAAAQQGHRVGRGLDRPPPALIVRGSLFDHPARRLQLLEPRRPARFLGLGFRGIAHPEEGLVHFLGALRVGPCLLPHARDRGGVEDSQRVGRLGVEDAARAHRLGPALFERRVVQERVGRRVQDAAREGGGLGGFHGDALDLA